MHVTSTLFIVLEIHYFHVFGCLACMYCLVGSVTPATGIHISKESGMFEWKFHPKLPLLGLASSPDSTSEKAHQMMTQRC